MVETILSASVHIALIFLAAVGALEVAALCNGFDGLAWPFGLRRRRPGYLLAALLMGVAFVGGLLLEPTARVSVLYLAVVLLVGGGLALAVVIVGAAQRLQRSRQRGQPSLRPGREVDLGPVRAIFYQPEERGPRPGVCLLPDPTAPGDDLTALVQALVKRGIAVLVFDWQSPAQDDRLTLHGFVAVGISHLARWPEVDTARVGLAGVGLGGDLALRSAAMDQDVAAVLAVEPILSSRRPGLGLEALRSLSWFEARRRAHAWRRSALVRGLDALGAIPCIAPRPAAVVLDGAGGSQAVGDLDVLRVEEGCVLVPTAHAGAVERAAQWLAEHLA